MLNDTVVSAASDSFGGENKNVIYAQHAIRKGQIAIRKLFYNIVQDLTTTKQMKTYKPQPIKIRAKKCS